MKVNKTLARIVFLLYLAVLMYLCFGKFSGLENEPRAIFGLEPDKVVHFLMFLPWPILAALSVLPNSTARSARTVVTLLIITLIGCALAGTTEYIQGLLPYRSRDILDFIADCLGLLSGALLFAAFYPFLRRSGTR